MGTKQKYIADAIYWNRLTKCWLRVRDLNLITFSGETSYTPAVPAGNGIVLIREAYPYEPWMEEFIGTDSKEINNRTKTWQQ